VRALIWMVGFITVQLVAVWPGVTDPSDLQLTPLVAKVHYGALRRLWLRSAHTSGL
jgi:hypothetical protein